MAGLGCLCSDYILQWPWLLISGTFRAPQQGAKQHEQTPLDGKGGRKHIEVDTHRNCSGAQSRAYVFVGHSRVPRNKRLEPQQGAAFTAGSSIVLPDSGLMSGIQHQALLRLCPRGWGTAYGKASETPLPQGFHQEENKYGTQNLRWQQERNRKPGSFRSEKGELSAFESELDSLITSPF